MQLTAKIPSHWPQSASEPGNRAKVSHQINEAQEFYVVSSQIVLAEPCVSAS